jgi:hypothetical protein
MFTHDMIKHVLRQIAEEAGFHAEEEVSGLIEGSREVPGDVVIHLGTHRVAVDVVVAHLQTVSNCETAAQHPGQAVMAAESVKRRRYLSKLEPGLMFVPFALDEFGHIGDAGWALLDQLAAHAAQRRTSDFRHGRGAAERRGYWMERWQERIAWALHDGITDSLHRRLALSRLISRRGEGQSGAP